VERVIICSAVDLLKTRLQQGDGSLNRPVYVSALWIRLCFRHLTPQSQFPHNLQYNETNCLNTRMAWSLEGHYSLAAEVRALRTEGTCLTIFRNVPGVALYMTSLTQLRSFLAKSPQFASMQKRVVNEGNSSVLPTLTSQGNLIAGATTRVAIGFLLNPFSVLKARFEVCTKRRSWLAHRFKHNHPTSFFLLNNGNPSPACLFLTCGL